MRIQHTDLSAPVYEQLKRMIITGELEPGEKIVQEKIAADLGVSRTPLNKALQRLESEFIVESIPRRGMYVKQVNHEELIEVYYCREAIEGMAARLVALEGNSSKIEELDNYFKPFRNKTEISIEEYSKADEAFHKALVRLSGNTYLDKIYFISNIYSMVIKQGLLRSPEETITEHDAIIQALKDGDADAAERFAREHTSKSRKQLEESIKK